MPTVELESGGRFSCDPGDTITRAGLRAGYPMPYACNSGSCANCRFTLVHGSVRHLREQPPGLSERDKSNNRWLGCQATPLTNCRIRIRLGDRADEVPLPNVKNATMVGSHEITHDMREFVFQVEGDDRFLPGQYALLYLPDVVGSRAYSMSNLPGNGEWRFVVKRVPGGAATSCLFDLLQPGRTVRVDGPYGLAYFKPTHSPLILVAGGSGLSPMLSIAKAVSLGPQAERPFHFFYGGRHPRDMCDDYLRGEIPREGLSLSLTSAISESVAGFDGPTGHIHEVMNSEVGHLLSEAEIYFAGPPPMTRAMSEVLFQAGVGRNAIHYDEFV